MSQFSKSHSDIGSANVAGRGEQVREQSKFHSWKEWNFERIVPHGWRIEATKPPARENKSPKREAARPRRIRPS